MNNFEYISQSNNFQYPNDNMNYQNMNIDDNRINYIPNMDDYNIQFLNENMQSIMPNNNTYSNNILSPYEGFIRGNLFNNLYDKYKNFKPANINSKNERENMLNQIQQYKFALTELDLYLDTHPNDSNIIKLFNNYLNIEKQICDKYESMYGPLTLDSEKLNTNNWVWINSPWPWEEI